MAIRPEGPVFYSFDNPPPNQWAIWQGIRDGEVAESFPVPFTQAELDLMQHAQEALFHSDFFKGHYLGGPERSYHPNMMIPTRHLLRDRPASIKMLRRTALYATEVLESGHFSAGLNSREDVSRIKDALSPFLPPVTPT